MSLSVDDRKIVYYSLIGPSTLSILGCSFILLMFASLKGLRSLPFKMISILSLFDLINAVGFLIPTYDVENSSSICMAQAVILNFSSFAGIVWTTFMAVFLLVTIKSLRTIEEKTVIKVLGTVILVSIADTVLPLVVYHENAYGKTKGWCWIQDEYRVLRYSLFFGPLFFIILLNFCIYFKVKSILGGLMQVENANNKMIRKIKKKLFLYPIILIICYLPYSAKALLEVLNYSENDFTFTIISVVLRSLHGFFNFLIYGLTTMVRKQLKRIFYTKLDDSLISLKKTNNSLAF